MKHKDPGDDLFDRLSVSEGPSDLGGWGALGQSCADCSDDDNWPNILLVASHINKSVGS